MFLEISGQLKAVDYFRRKLHIRCLEKVLNTPQYSATQCLEKLRTLIRLIQLQCKFTHFKIQT